MLSKRTGTVETIRDWDRLVDSAVFAYNIAYQESIQDSPFFFLHGRDAVLPPDRWVFNHAFRVMKSSIHSKSDILRNFERTWDRAVQATQKTIERRQAVHDRSHKGISFEIGERCWVYIPEIFSQGVHRKLLFSWHCPYRIVGVERDGLLYYVQTERGRRIKQLFHVRRLKKFVNPNDRPKDQLTQMIVLRIN
jgi:hypothetical protein